MNTSAMGELVIQVFDPLSRYPPSTFRARVFIPLGLVFFCLGLLKLVIDFTYWNLSETTVFAFLTAIMIWSLGLIADMISRLHLRP